MRVPTSCVCLCLLVAGSARAQDLEPRPRTDPVELLRQALRAPVRGPAARDAQLKAAVEALQSPDELQRALLLNGWRDGDPDEGIAAVDIRRREALIERYERAVRSALRRDALESRLAAVQMIAAVDPELRGRTEAPLSRDFTGDLAGLTRSGPAALREMAAHTLGRVSPEPTAAAAALAALLRDPDPRLRATAGDALAALVTTAVRLASGRGAGDEVSAAACAAVPVAAHGMGDASADVRQHCAEALGRAAEALGLLTAEVVPAEEVEDWAAYQRDVEEERAALRPLIAVLRDQAAALARGAADADARVRIPARHALEDVATARLKLLRRASSALAAPPGEGDPAATATAAFLLEDPLLAGLRPALPALTAGVEDADVEARRAAIDALEAMGRHAAPAAPALVTALSDRDRFVRWSAARALGKVRPPDTTSVVPALARLLADGDCDVRLAAAAALGAYGPGARAALPALAEAAHARDPDLRLAALRALDGIGSDDAAALAVLSAALTDADVRVRRLAEEVRERQGPSPRDAANALLLPSPRQEGTPVKAVGSVRPHD
jgi:HEAT repeat protein